MPDNNNDTFSLQYTGEGAKTVQDTIREGLTTAHDSYDTAVDDWDTIRTKFTVDSEIESEFEKVTLTGKNEVAKIFSEIDTLIAGINNIDMSWHEVANSVKDALRAYNSGEGD